LSLAFVTEIADKVESDRRVTVRKLTRTHGVSTKTIHYMLLEELSLSKKSPRWVSEILSHDMKKERVRTSEEFLNVVCRNLMSMLDNVVTMDKSAASFHTPETK
jgi:hypothetical protein